MKMNGISMVSSPNEIVNIYGEWRRRTVYHKEGEWKFFIRVNKEWLEVFHKSYYYSMQE